MILYSDVYNFAIHDLKYSLVHIQRTMSSAEEDNSTFTDVINHRMMKRKTIDSFSMIIHTIIDGNIYYLLGRVRDTIPFKEFIRGNIKDVDMIRYTMHMAAEEKHRLLTESFQELVDDVIINHSSRAYRSACECKEEFDVNIKKYETILRDPTICQPEAPWIFPKGRKQDNETDRDCALREFSEETRISSSFITLYDEEPLEEIYTGLDSKLYRTVYFIGFMNYLDFKIISPDIRRQFIITNKRVSLSDEIAKIKFLPYDDAILKLDATKRYILRCIHTFLIFHLDRPVYQRYQSI
jgi:8-oxo-dGTP pyrophosphatase MutT (NUDIX family)